MGRPTDFTPEIATAICLRLMEGESLASICRGDDMPARSTVHLWLLEHREFSDSYTRAREVQGHNLADDTVEIADDGTNDWMERRRQDGSVEIVPNHEHIARSKLRIDTRKWMAAKLAPKKYGDRQTVEHEGTVGVEHSERADPRSTITHFLTRKAAEQKPADETKH